VVVTYDSGDDAVAYRGVVADNIPPGALDLITPTTSSVFPRPFRSTVRRVVPLPVFLVGSDTVQVSVKPVLR
jgi:hypothetical protein